MNLSFWEYNSFLKNIDVAIIGGGLVGLNAAIYLKTKSPNLKVVVLEKGFLPFGASTRNAGFACFGSISELINDIENSTEDEVLQLVEKRWKGLHRLRQNIGDKNLHFQPLGGYELFKENDNELFENCNTKVHFFNQRLKNIIGTHQVYRLADDKIKSFGLRNTEHLILNTAEGQINTGEMMKHLQYLAAEKGVKLLNGVDVSSIEEKNSKVEITTKEGIKIEAKKVVFATNGFSKKLLPDIKLSPARNQVLVTNEISNLKLKGTFHYDEGFIYFRNIKNRVLIGGARNLAKEQEATSEFGLTNNIKNHLISILKNEVLPNQKFIIEHEWSGIMGVGKIKKPIIKKYKEHLFLAIRLGGMGVAIGSLVGEEVAELVLQNL